jgi:hypothetical protein
VVCLGAAMGAHGGVLQEGGAARGCLCVLSCCSWSLFYVRAGRKQEEGERRGKKEKEAKEKKKI